MINQNVQKETSWLWKNIPIITDVPDNSFVNFAILAESVALAPETDF